MKYIPCETSVVSSAKVVNVFEKMLTKATEKDEEEEIPEDEMTTV
jgi:hypothetical protein